MISVAVQSFGKEYELRRATFALLSLFAHTTIPHSALRVFLFTDNPDYFKQYLSELPVEYILLTQEKIKSMRGDIDFLHRMKIALIEETLQQGAGDLLYFDSDTFFIADPKDLLRQLSADRSFMHVHEYKFEEMSFFPLPGGASFHRYLDLIRSQEFRLADGTDFRINPAMSSWNAGVMMLHRSHRRFIPDVYALTDQTYPPTENHASEQYAFSVVLQSRTMLTACDEVVFHYWYRVKKQIMDEFLTYHFDENFATASMPQKLRQVHEWTRLLPDHFDRHVLTLRDNAIQKLNENAYREGYAWAARALMKAPLSDTRFIRDVLYHVKRQAKGE